MKTLSTSQLFALSRGVHVPRGNKHCFYCGAECDEEFPARDFVRPTFTGRDTVRGGDFVCVGCALSVCGKIDVQFHDGLVRENQMARTYSWVLSTHHAVAATKKHRDWLLGQCLDPPEPPFAIIISDSGQKHLIYRGFVSRSRDTVLLTLETELIAYRPCELSARLQLCKRVASVLGKPALSGHIGYRQQMMLTEHHGDESLPAAWLSVAEQPLTRLAAWLTPAKKECQIELAKNTSNQ